MLNKVFLSFAFLLLVYLIAPGPGSISQFEPLPNSAKSDLAGDTWQIPNVSAYFSDNYRGLTTKFYKDRLQKNTWFFFPPKRLNYPPEESFIYIKKHTDSTYLEEYVYPMRESIFVNGFEPFYEDGQPKYWGASGFDIGDKRYYTKATLRLYPSPLWARLVVWIGVLGSIWALWKIGRRVVRE